MKGTYMVLDNPERRNLPPPQLTVDAESQALARCYALLRQLARVKRVQAEQQEPPQEPDPPNEPGEEAPR